MGLAPPARQKPREERRTERHRQLSECFTYAAGGYARGGQARAPRSGPLWPVVKRPIRADPGRIRAGMHRCVERGRPSIRPCSRAGHGLGAMS